MNRLQFDPTESLSRAAFDHVQDLTHRWLVAFLMDRQSEIAYRLCDRTAMEATHEWWRTTATELLEAGCPNLDGEEGLVEGLDDARIAEGGPAVWVDAGIFGIHFLVRVGRRDALRYFAPPEGEESRAAPRRMVPYRSRWALRGVVLHRQWVEGIRDLEFHVPASGVGKGSFLSARHGVHQYIPDFRPGWGDVGGVPYQDIDKLTRNLSSIYLPLSVGRPEEDLDALLIVQCAIPNLLGPRWLVDRSVSLDGGHGEAPVVDEGFFTAVRRGLFGPQGDSGEAVRLARVLREMSGMRESINEEVAYEITSRAKHIQALSWPYVLQAWRGAVPRWEVSEGRRKLATMMLHHLALPALLEDEERLGARLRGAEVDLESLVTTLLEEKSRLVSDLQGVDDSWAGWRPTKCQHLLTPGCWRGCTSEEIALMALLEMIKNAGKHGGAGGEPYSARIVLGCFECLRAVTPGQYLELSGESGAFQWSGCNSGVEGPPRIFLGVLDRGPPMVTPPGRGGGVRQLVRAIRAHAIAETPVWFGILPIPKEVPTEFEGFRKVALLALRAAA